MASSPSGHGASPQPTDTSRNAILALLLLLPVPSVATAASLFWWPEAIASKVFFIAGKLWIIALPLFWTKFVERQPLSWSPPRRDGFGMGIALGFVIAAGILASYALARNTSLMDPAEVSERAARTGLNHLSFYLGGALYWITLNSLMEEYVWRWFVFRKFEALIGGRLAVVAAGLGFTAHHIVALAAQFNWTVTAIGSLGVFIGGATWSWLYLRYRSIWPCYVSHAIVDAPIFWIGYQLIFK